MTLTSAAPVEQHPDLRALPDLHLPVAFVAAAPISHGAGNAGNTQLLRHQDITVDGRRVRVPYVSGNSVRHLLRDALAWHLARTLDLPDGSLPKRVVDLLWSGGALTSTGNQAELAVHRRVTRTLWGTSALGYSAKSDIVAGTVSVDMVHLVCRENVFRMPPPLAAHAHASLPAATWVGREFGTRHDVARSAPSRLVALAGAADLWGVEQGTFTESTQMIHDMQVVKPGAILYTTVRASAPTAGHVAALAVALDEAAPLRAGQRVVHLGGKRAQGFGACVVHADLGAVFGDVGDLRAVYEQHLRDNRAEVLSLISEVTG